MAIQKSTSLHIKRQNRRNVMRFVLEKESTSRQEVAQALQISMPTVLQNINELQQMGLVQETGQFESTGGRKANVIMCSADALYSLGIDITRNHVSMVLANLAGEITHSFRNSFPYENMPDYYVELGKLAQKFMLQYPQTTGRVIGAGVSIPGILDKNGTMLTHSHALGVHHIECSVFQKELPWSCVFENDANAAGLAEMQSMPKDSTMVYLSLSNSVGGAIFFDGKLYKGLNQHSGEFGHMRLIPDGASCYCGQKGCLDAYCSALRLARAANGKLGDFFIKLQNGDPDCNAIWQDYLDKLAIAITNLRMNFDCNIVLGGFVGSYLEPWLPQLRQLVIKLDPFGETCTYLGSCQYKSEASAYGAAMQPLTHFLDNL